MSTTIISRSEKPCADGSFHRLRLLMLKLMGLFGIREPQPHRPVNSDLDATFSDQTPQSCTDPRESYCSKWTARDIRAQEAALPFQKVGKLGALLPQKLARPVSMKDPVPEAELPCVDHYLARLWCRLGFRLGLSFAYVSTHYAFVNHIDDVKHCLTAAEAPWIYVKLTRQR